MIPFPHMAQKLHMHFSSVKHLDDWQLSLHGLRWGVIIVVHSSADVDTCQLHTGRQTGVLSNNTYGGFIVEVCMAANLQ